VLPTFTIVVKIGFKEIGEKEKFQDNKHHKQFEQDNDPDLTAPAAHVFKPLKVKFPDAVKNVPVQIGWLF